MTHVSTTRAGTAAPRVRGSAPDESGQTPVRLADGRALAYAAHGPASGRPVLYFHGTPGSKHNWFLNHDEDLLEELGLRVLAIDRPGLGHSTFQAGRTLHDWPEDVREFADRAALDRFAVLGYSCGAPYALACAVRLGEQVTQTIVVSGYADANHPDLASTRAQQNLQILRLGADRPWSSRAIYRTMGTMARIAPGLFVRQALTTMPPADRQVLSQPPVRQAFLTMLHETLRQGPGGVQLDSAIVASPWDLPLDRISSPVTLWHGTEDRNAPPVMARHLAERIPGAELHVVRGEGHLSLVHRHAPDILRAMG